ncbi:MULTISPECIES: (d)CMP kinase [Methanothermobacter]|uniref:Cytidylate kinase n=1 Tax=Methanothermobacter defluvii TaxID=49339 RepID=A0A371NCF7_9EURY|nr:MULTISPECIES: AAA family ATPase [Methanothermobacter]MBC7110692.1 AAA family ATPase [Methanothermobacter sp.]MDK2874674.1 CMP/dCMP kinase [Methanothermobacter sp.]NLU04992.1 AAA family ATPase [Methanothermobacter sp.]REE25221.1 cytidylate kinase [Methanothermobacter defluvii]WBF06395.1 AAA family ATPase [Methanothermobacter thermautotrophicus]
MIITIGGLAGTGTTTVARILSERMGIPCVSAGDVFRQMAAERELDILEFSRIAEENPEIDIEIDRRQARLADEHEDLILEGRLSAHFARADLKVLLIAPFDVRAQRISVRESKDIETVREEIRIRERSEAQRYREIHGIDVDDLEVYDIVINTSRFDAEGVADIILKVTEVI